MKKIMYAGISPDFNSDQSGRIYRWTESSEAECGNEWNGDVRGYIENAAEGEPQFLENGDGFTIENLPAGALILADDNGEPREIWWAE